MPNPDLELKVFERYVGYTLFRKKAGSIVPKPAKEPVKQVFTYQFQPEPSEMHRRLLLEIELVPFVGVQYDLYGRPKGPIRFGTDTNECKRMKAATKALRKGRKAKR